MSPRRSVGSRPLAEFDRYRDDYREQVQRSIAFSGQDADFFIQAKAQHLESVMRSRDLPPDAKILDVGCGTGLTDHHLRSHYDCITGIDPAWELAARAKDSSPSLSYLAGDGLTLPFSDGTFDVAFAICVMHHVPPSKWAEFLEEMARVTRKGGTIAIYEHNPFNPLTRLAVARCEFDEDAVLLRRAQTLTLMRGAGLKDVTTSYILFFPWPGRILRAAEHRMRSVPLGAQYAAVGTK